MAGLPIENLSMTREINMVYHKDFEHTDLLQNIMRIYNEYSVAGAVEGKVRPKEVHFVDHSPTNYCKIQADPKSACFTGWRL